MTRRFEAAWSAWNQAPRSRSRAGPAGRSPRSTTPGSPERRSSAPPTPSWQRRSPSCGRRRRGRVRRLQPRGPLHVLRGLRGEGRAPPAAGGGARPHRRPPRLRQRADRAVLPRPRDLPARGLRPRARRRLGRAAPRHVRRRRRLLVLRHEDRVDRRGRGAGVGRRRSARARPRLPRLRQARPRGRRPELPHERVHRGARARPGRADGGDRGVEERRRPRASRSGPPAPPCAARRHGLRASTSTSSSVPIERSTGKVYADPCHRIMGTHDDLPNTDWVAENHWCVPLYYRLEDSAS